MNKMPLSYQVLTNLNCNLACTYCYENKGRGANDVEAIKEFLGALYERDFGAEDSDKEREVHIEFVGGETLMYPKLLDEACEYALALEAHYGVKTPFVTSVSTNGTLIGNIDVLGFIAKWKSRLSLGFSIDGTKEIHDAARVDADGRGSYDRAAEGLRIARQFICPKRIGVKATYTHSTIGKWAEGIINLIELGFTQIAANGVFEEAWTLDEDAPVIASQMCKVVDYLFEHGIHDKVHVLQINNAAIDMSRFGDRFWKREGNYCGSCTHMRCLGFDRLIYGCNRFCTMKAPIPIGRLDNGKIAIIASDFITEVSEQYKLWPKECMECDYSAGCSMCAAIPYEQNGPEEFLRRKGQCGFTHAIVFARLYFRKKLDELRRQTHGTSA